MKIQDKYYMQLALDTAKIAESENEIPVGAIIVKNDTIISCGYNKREIEKNALYHAEIEAINNACKSLGGWRLCGCDLYVTLEPCPMCAGAIINARIERIVFGAYDKKSGACGSVINLFNYSFNHHPQIVGGILQKDCSEILSNFFKKIRNK